VILSFPIMITDPTEP